MTVLIINLRSQLRNKEEEKSCQINEYKNEGELDRVQRSDSSSSMTQNIINIASQMIMFHSSMLKENRKNLPIYRFSFQNKKKATINMYHSCTLIQTTRGIQGSNQEQPTSCDASWLSGISPSPFPSDCNRIFCADFLIHLIIF